jgi:hypothetical protein
MQINFREENNLPFPLVDEGTIPGTESWPQLPFNSNMCELAFIEYRLFDKKRLNP